MQSRQTDSRQITTTEPHRIAPDLKLLESSVATRRTIGSWEVADDQVSTSKASIADAARHGVTSMTHARASVLQCNMVVPPMAELAW